MKYSNMKLIIERNWENRESRLYLMTDQGRDRVIIGYQDGMLVEQKLNPLNAEVVPIIPLLKMHDGFVDEFLKAVTDYTSNMGVKTENENLLIGKLKATEKHLEDLRKNFDKLLDKVIQ